MKYACKCLCCKVLVAQVGSVGCCVFAHLMSAHALAVLILTSSSCSSPTRGATTPPETQATFPPSDTLQATAHVSENCEQDAGMSRDSIRSKW